MNIAKFGVMMGVCGYLCLAFLASAEAGEIEQPVSDIAFESWLHESGRVLPVLSFDSVAEQTDRPDDIQAVNIVREKDGSTRFQLSHRGPLGRQVFANVRNVEQADGFTRHIITSIADGSQQEFLSRTDDLPAFDRKEKGGVKVPVSGLEKAIDQDTECFPCLLLVAAAISCVVAENRAYQMCYENCQSMGGIQHFESGTCGAFSSECRCYTLPPKTAIEF